MLYKHLLASVRNSIITNCNNFSKNQTKGLKKSKTRHSVPGFSFLYSFFTFKQLIFGPDLDISQQILANLSLNWHG
ncbi:hypothetical protein COT98_02830 [Candidatus Falkowbacteria bacterium CG10_big_fil_rev_8_21_14_0_10_39_9]|uniref:Uncharacterized protein n=1 Tax=Candidatus Falkowbacteria bacterium CG10_big_fil_rev_8_21_14_0_10_39_9 TaxID=1974566 RepID=A0A2M6WP39_9BACT|nr:MAG: hypothetical protein COT98_02830 [Candidatus Falkowbacteria bacterium CG10_big_fil_rev_8_21_14_0_10_39_9]